MPSLKITGLSEAMAALRRLKASTPERIVRPAIRAALEDLRGRAEAGAPVDSGTLAGSLVVLDAPRRPGRVAGSVVATAPYSFHADEGTHGHPGSHWMEHAAKEGRGRAVRTFGDALRRAIDRAAR
jgi:HK97 gp10 family phage protein